jgi:FtsP/CotA-like multicopper oxidase with cupredoxin domain
MKKIKWAPIVAVVAILTLGAAVAFTSGAAGLGTRNASPDYGLPLQPRELHLVVRGMSYYIDGERTPNPTLYVRRGERIRLVLNNSDAGMTHDFTIEAMNVHTRLLKGTGEDAVEFIAPRVRGSHTYRCTPHSAMMNGTIVVN